jgi:hypothetical protein
MPPADAQDPRQCTEDNECEELGEDAPAERPGLPEEATVVSEETVTSPKGRKYRILRTTQMDPYDEPQEEEDSRS